ncbi:MAG: glycosyltransferase family 25 protein [Desulfobacter sp.]|nr:MAG: glycosyltransferase family 25 protein [Desulfobacter sp.]
MKDQFDRLNQPFEWILDHDKNEITQKVMDAYQYKGNMNIEAVSCALKHIRAWEKIAQSDESGGFVFEDDVLINTEKFKNIFHQAFLEYQKNWPASSYISLGSGCALYVPWTKKIKPNICTRPNMQGQQTLTGSAGKPPGKW